MYQRLSAPLLLPRNALGDGLPQRRRGWRSQRKQARGDGVGRSVLEGTLQAAPEGPVAEPLHRRTGRRPGGSLPSAIELLIREGRKIEETELDLSPLGSGVTKLVGDPEGGGREEERTKQIDGQSSVRVVCRGMCGYRHGWVEQRVRLR